MDIFSENCHKNHTQKSENLPEMEKQQIPRGAREARPPWGAAESGTLVVFVFLVGVRYHCEWSLWQIFPAIFLLLFYVVQFSQGIAQQAFIAGLQKKTAQTKQQKCKESVRQNHTKHTQRGRTWSARAPFWTVWHVFVVQIPSIFAVFLGWFSEGLLQKTIIEARVSHRKSSQQQTQAGPKNEQN